MKTAEERAAFKRREFDRMEDLQEAALYFGSRPPPQATWTRRDRDRLVLQHRNEGWTYQQLANWLNLSVQRVKDICTQERRRAANGG